MFSVHLTRKRGEVIAVADIGSGSVAVAILALRAGFPASVLAAARVTLPFEERSKEATIAGLGEHLAQAGEQVVKAYLTKTPQAAPVEELYCIIRAPWSSSKTVRAESRFEKDTNVTDRVIGALAQHALASDTEFDRQNLLEASVIRVRLNGYATGAPEGKRAREIALFALVSDCDADIRAAARAALQKAFPTLTPLFRSSTRALLTVLGDLKQEQGDVLVADVGMEGTMLTVVEEGVVGQQHYVAEGMRSILRRVASSGMPEETLNLIRMAERDQCSTAACESVRESMARVEPELVRTFGEGMAACIPLRKLPERLLLITHPDIALWLSKFFARIDFTQFTQTTQPFRVETLSLKELSRFVEPQPGVQLDTGLALSAALVNIEKSRG